MVNSTTFDSTPTPNVAILGGGASGAYINRACYLAGIRPDAYVFQKNTGAKGAFWLRIAPGVNASPKKIFIRSRGTAEKYMEKQWGDEFKDYPSSFKANDSTEMGFDPHEIIPLLWYGCSLLDIAGTISDEDIYDVAQKYDIVFCTFPTVKATLERSYDRVYRKCLYAKIDHSVNYTEYYGTASKIVRRSQLFGFEYLELGRDSQYFSDRFPNCKYIRFPDLKPDTVPWDPKDVPAKNVVLVGRFATFDRKALAHDAYSKAMSVIANFKMGKDLHE